MGSEHFGSDTIIRLGTGRRHMERISINGATVSYRLYGSGEPVVALHSTADSGGQWESFGLGEVHNRCLYAEIDQVAAEIARGGISASGRGPRASDRAQVLQGSRVRWRP